MVNSYVLFFYNWNEIYRLFIYKALYLKIPPLFSIILTTMSLWGDLDRHT